MLSNLKLILCDLDGTLLNDHKAIDTDIVEVKKELDKNGIQLTLVTGRNYHIMQEFVDRLDIDIPYITNNGANIYHKGKCIKEFCISNNDLQLIISILNKEMIAYLAYSNLKVYNQRDNEDLTHFMKRLEGKVDIIKLAANELIEDNIFKMVIVNDDEILMKNIMNEINESCEAAHCVRSEDNIYTVTHIMATKGNAVNYLLKSLSVNKEQVVAFGDNYNDVSMFESVGISVAMDNASEEVKQKVDYVALSNNKNGVSSFIKENILNII